MLAATLFQLEYMRLKSIFLLNWLEEDGGGKKGRKEGKSCSKHTGIAAAILRVLFCHIM